MDSLEYWSNIFYGKIASTSKDGLNNNPIFDSRGISPNAVSLDSIECLLTPSIDTTSGDGAEDVGISMIFSDCKKFTNSTPGNDHNVIHDSRNSPIVTTNQSISHNPNCNNKRMRVEIQPQNLMSNYSTNAEKSSFQLIPEVPFKKITSAENIADPKSKKLRLEKQPISSSNINFQQTSSSTSSVDEPDTEAIAQMKEMIYRAAAFRPVNFGVETVERPKRKNVKISNDPQTVAARERREKISERIRVLQSLVPGASKMDTASMLDEAANYLKFLRSQVKALEALGNHQKFDMVNNFPANVNFTFSPFGKYLFSVQQQFSIQNHSHAHEFKR